MYISKDEKPLAEVTLKYSIVEDAPIRTFEVDSPGFQSGASDGWLDYNLAVSQPPPMYTVRKACVWVQGDRSNCKDKKWTTCDVTSLTDDLVQVNFGCRAIQKIQAQKGSVRDICGWGINWLQTPSSCINDEAARLA